jgi:UDP-N-acetylglucosamine--N-acetylmuramyl-(pentapeptide) pyrophosphoryl-undecaprenol N-acetylglucosamine transferase
MKADSKPASFVVTGGGTGGHVMPAIAVARELRSRGHAVRFIGTKRGLEAKLVPPEGFPIEWIEIGGLNRVGIRQKAATLAELPFSVWTAARMLDRDRPAAVFSTGGFVAGPVLLAALWRRVPVVVMEPNAIPGFTHRKLARFVARALVSFPETAKWFPADVAEVTGMPVREEFFAIPVKPRGAVLTVLITGGSQGSRTLNRAAQEAWRLWQKLGDKAAVHLIHQTGPARSGIEGELAYESVPFLAHMPAAFASADVVVSRAGMSTVSELAAAGKPSILVPLPTAADQHQLRNAEAMEKLGAARFVLDSEFNGQRLVDEILRLSQSPDRLNRMGEAARSFSKPGAARRAADVLESFT